MDLEIALLIPLRTVTLSSVQARVVSSNRLYEELFIDSTLFIRANFAENPLLTTLLCKR